MMSFFRKVKGSVSLILIFVMFPLLTQATMIVDASRINSAKTAVSGAGDLAMNAALSQYDRALQDVYGLFAVSGDDIGSLQDAFEAYFGNTLQGMLTGTDSTTMEYIDQLTSGVVDGIFGNENISDEDMVNHLAMNTIDLTIKANNQSTLGNPAVMKGQIVEYMKYKAPLMFTTSILDQMNALGSSKAQSDAVQAQVEYTETLDSLQSSCDAARKSIDTYNDSVVALNTAAGEPNKVSVMFADGGTVKSELTSATNNMLYYRNIYDKYWTGDSAVGMNMATIFAIRFVLNTIYAFTSAEIQSTACSIATAIAGWTVFGVPLVQAIVTMVFALAESGLDLAELSRGESVPIYKTATTWKCSISGITREATEMVIDQAVEKGTEFLTELADDTITDLSESANTYINGQIDSAVSTVKDTLFASTTGAVLEMYGMLGDEVTNSENETKAKIREALERAKSNVGNDTPVQKAANEGMSLIVGSLETEIVDSIYGCLKDTIGKGEDFIYEFQKSVSEKIDSFVDEHLKTTIKSKIDTLSSKLKEAANTNIENASEEVKKQAKDAVKEAFDEYAGDAVDAVQKTDIKDTKTISMNYKQYTKIFMLVGLLTNQDTLLRRCAALIQCNMNHAPNDFKGADYKLSIPNSYTMIEANGEVEINTIFSYSAETTGAAPTAADGGLYSDLAPIWQNSGKSVMKYHSILGY